MIKAVYVKSNTWKEGYKLEEKKGVLLLHDSRLFYSHRVNMDSKFWKCTKSKDALIKCSGSCTVNSEDVIIRQAEHKCKPLSDLEIEVLKFNINVKQRAMSEDAGPSAIFYGERNKLIK